MLGGVSAEEWRAFLGGIVVAVLAFAFLLMSHAICFTTVFLGFLTCR